MVIIMSKNREKSNEKKLRRELAIKKAKQKKIIISIVYVVLLTAVIAFLTFLFAVGTFTGIFYLGMMVLGWLGIM